MNEKKIVALVGMIPLIIMLTVGIYVNANELSDPAIYKSLKNNFMKNIWNYKYEK